MLTADVPASGRPTGRVSESPPARREDPSCPPGDDKETEGVTWTLARRRAARARACPSPAWEIPDEAA
ncbi:hypothetical protein ACFOYY_08455 [Streptosporangium jomthongense]|uniref:Uncharacterized protein n=1 Tax=Streptosporangium jomthongense TaxID=1193683 RepID=A0ABV8EV50_9ACTN